MSNRHIIAFPYHILYLKGVQLSYIKVYEIIFHLWQARKPCFISNPEFCRRTLLADSTIREALAFFEKEGEIKRIQKGKRRFILQPVRALEIEDDIEEAVDNPNQNSPKNSHAAEIAAATRRDSSGQPAEIAAHIINKEAQYNKPSINKSFYKNKSKNEQKEKNETKHSFANSMNNLKTAPLASPVEQSTSYQEPVAKDRFLNKDECINKMDELNKIFRFRSADASH